MNLLQCLQKSLPGNHDQGDLVQCAAGLVDW